MSQLSQKKCVPCDDQSPLEEMEIKKYLVELKDGWEVVENKKIKKHFEFKNFKEAIKFVNKVAGLAEQENHHPDINIRFRKVDLVLWTYKIGGLSENDFIVASKIDEL